ncbi:MAG: hypothetical protein JNM52_01815 [Betaproteobacteria bacterium]|nr:hypothetical protein [Betaproteobacteria bacterium]
MDADHGSHFMDRAREARYQEVHGMQGTGLVQQRLRELRQTRFVHSNPLSAPLFSMQTGSASHDQRTAQVADRMLSNMMDGARKLSQLHQRAPRFHEANPFQQLAHRVDNATTKMHIDVDQSTSPHYAHEANKISLMNVRAVGPFSSPDVLNQAGHEMQHAYDHLHGFVDLGQPDQRLASELSAFRQQRRVAQETIGRDPHLFAGRTPAQMAESYHGKANYPGTLQESLDKVTQWRANR